MVYVFFTGIIIFFIIDSVYSYKLSQLKKKELSILNRRLDILRTINTELVNQRSLIWSEIKKFNELYDKFNDDCEKFNDCLEDKE